MEKSPNKKLLVFISFVILLIILVATYFLAWRPSDSDYEVASKNLDAVTNSYATLELELLMAKSPDKISNITSLKIGVLSELFDESLGTFLGSGVISRDFAVGATMNKHRESFTKYNDSVKKLAQSMKIYTTIVNSCNAYIKSDKQNTNDLLNKCENALENGAKSEYEPFNNQFFDNYRTQVGDFVSDTDNKNGELPQPPSKQLDYKLPVLIDGIEEIETVLNTQKTAFWR